MGGNGQRQGAMHDYKEKHRKKLASEGAAPCNHIRRIAATSEAKRKELAWVETAKDRVEKDYHNS